MFFQLLIVSVLVLAHVPVTQASEEPSGYRLDSYDAAVPETLRGAIRVTALQVADLQQKHSALVIDVIPEHIKPEALPEGQMWFPVKHKGIAGALWLPDVGYGSLSDATLSYFKRHLQTSTNDSYEHPIVFYCRSNCWMSWNAAKRALSFGYSQVYWFADGIEYWNFEGLETQVLEPAAGARH